MSSVVVSFSKLVEKSEGLTPMLHRENILDKKIPERIATLAKEHSGIALEIAEGDDLFFGDAGDLRWEQELRTAIRKAQEELCEKGEDLPQIDYVIVAPA